MFSALKKLFGKSQEPAPASTPSAPAAASSAAPAAAAGGQGGSGAPGPDDITVSLKGVIAGLPDPLKKKLDRSVTGSELIWIRRDNAMRQLATGSVKIPFSEVMRMAPNYFLTPDRELLGTMVNLPLQEILPKIKALPRRTTQKQVEVPQDLAPVFGAGKESVKPIAATSAPAAAAAPAPAPAAPVAEKPMAIPAPPTRPVPPPPAPPVPKAPAAPASGEPYVPPATKTLEPQAPISFKLPGQEASAAASAPAPQPAAPAPAPVVPQPVRPATPPPPAFKPARPTPAATPVAAADGPVIAIGDIFGQPDKKDWTPQEIVERASTLRGVAGALITTIDGLPVAHHLPSNLSGNAVAAFVPQMFTRIVQYTRDLKLGDAKHITILIENVPLQIFKAGGVYFTALGRANENLPKPQLTAIAGALSRQSPS